MTTLLVSVVIAPHGVRGGNMTTPDPFCVEFRDKDVLDYLHWVNVMKGNHN